MNDILKEIDVKDNTFNLKSASTGKYSVQDSYKDNLANGFLNKINAPADVNLSLKDIYYATEKGLIISYKDFNGKIAANRKSLLEKNYPNTELKDLDKNERIKLETESAKIVLKELFINENTKLIYSPEFTNIKEEETLKNTNIKFNINELKILFISTSEQEKESKESLDEANKEELINTFLDLSDYIKKEFETLALSFNLDEIELGLLNINKKFDSIKNDFKENEDIKNLYNESIQSINDKIAYIKEHQVIFENEMEALINDIIENKKFNEIKPTISRIEEYFKFNILANDPKTISIKDFTILRLTNIGKTIALLTIEEWSETNFKTAEDLLLNYTLPSNFEDLLIKKQAQQNLKKQINEENLSKIDINDIEQVYSKLLELSNKKDLFKSFFELVVKDSYEIINQVIKKYPNPFEFVVIIANNIKYENFVLLWDNLDYELISDFTANEYDYEHFSKNKVKNLFIQTLIKNGTQERIEAVFSSIKFIFLRNLDLTTLKMAFLKLRTFAFPLEELAKKLLPQILLELDEIEELKADIYIRNTLIRTIVKWFTTFDINNELFKEILRKYPEAIYKLSPKKAKTLPVEFVAEIIDILETKHREDLEQFLLRVGKENIDKVVEYKLKSALEENPNSFDIHYDLGITYLNKNDLQNAIFEFKKCLSLNPQSHLAYFNLGVTYEKDKHYDLAIAQYKKSTVAKFGFNEGYFALGSLYLKMKEPFLAVKQLKSLQKADPNHYDCCINLGVAYEDLNELDNALLEYEKAIKIDETKVDAYINKGVCLVAKGNVDEAIETFEKVGELVSDNAKVQYNLAVLYQQKGDTSLAMAHYKLAIKLDQTNSQAYNNLGLIHFSKMDLDHAVPLWEKAIEIDNNIDAYNNLAWAYYVVGETYQCIEIYKKAKMVNPKHAVLSMNLGTAYFKIGDIDNAIKQFEAFVELEPDTTSGQEVSKILKSLKKT
ncbi:MAG: tetratricopeptide repeat protein [Candidatus Sericytochromatia bacterium]